MTPKFESQDSARTHSPEELLTNTLKRDRFELLSAYLDSEVTAAERRQVDFWLATDPEIQRLYRRLINLRQGLQTMPVPLAQQPAEHTTQQVFARLHTRHKRAVVWGGTAIAAVLIGALPGILLERQPVSQVAQVPQPSEPLMVALNTPVVEIPKVPASASGKPTKPSQFPHQPLTNQNVY